jgi:hypothetical protein
MEAVVSRSSQLSTSDRQLPLPPHPVRTIIPSPKIIYIWRTPSHDRAHFRFCSHEHVQPRRSCKKKSHARKQPQGHIPRPRNAFILFRCDFVAQKKIPASVEPDHRNISRIVGRIWKAMSDEDRRPWVEEAKKEREKHKRLYPLYRYSPTSAATAATTALKEKRAQNQRIRESMGVLPTWELASHTKDSLQSWSQLAQKLRPHATSPGGVQTTTRVTAS